MENGKGLELLSSEIIKSISHANKDDDLKIYAGMLSEKIDLTQKVLKKLMPLALKGDYERFLADASVFMEFFSLIIISWSWLDIGITAKNQLERNNFDHKLLNGKMEAMKYFFLYELPKTTGLAEVLMNLSDVTIKKEDDYLS